MGGVCGKHVGRTPGLIRTILIVGRRKQYLWDERKIKGYKGCETGVDLVLVSEGFVFQGTVGNGVAELVSYGNNVKPSALNRMNLSYCRDRRLVPRTR